MMLRALLPDEPELVKLCRSKKWMAVSIRSQSHPFEASPSEWALCGDGDTALGLAVRSGAPIETVQFLVEANIHQVGIIRQSRGSILTEALRYRVSDDVLDYLLRAVIHYERASQKLDLLGATDDLGRTALHYMVERSKQCLERRERNCSNWFIFRNMFLARPCSVVELDSDGNTPLILLLLLTRLRGQEPCPAVEDEIYRMVQLMVSTCPGVAAITRTLPKPWQDSGGASGKEMEGAPTPLYYAILHGRSPQTIHALIDANREAGINACATLISHYHEVPLHTAIGTQSPTGIVTLLLQHCPKSALCPDGNGLTPVDWLWIRHVVDWHSDNTPSTLASKGRFLASRFLDWHDEVTNSLMCDGNEMTGTTYACHNRLQRMSIASCPLRQVTKDLLARMELLLPVAASVAVPETTSDSWSLIHAACFVPCPLAAVHLALEHTEPTVLQIPDSQHRLPLHWAAARFGYVANYPVGFSRSVQRLVEGTVVPLILSRFPQACTIPDSRGQLPLHIALDAARHYREEIADPCLGPARFKQREVDAMEDETLGALIKTFPESLECRDGKSRLFPFQQAATGKGARLDTIYVLLRKMPSLLFVGTVDNDDFMDTD